jgi:integrase
MSVHERKRAGSKRVYQVTWRDQDGRQRAETYPDRRSAERRDAEIADLRWDGRLQVVDAGSEPLRDAAEEWWTDHVDPTLAQSTKESYAHVLDVHLLPRLGDVPLRDIDPARVIELQRELRRDRIGPSMTHRILMVLSGICRHALIRGRIDRNPVQPVRIAQPRRTRAIHPVAPATVEALRAHLRERDDYVSAMLVVLLAYAGLRPGEATELFWRDVREHTLLVERARDVAGITKATKTHTIRTVRLLEPLAADLHEWQRRSGEPGEDALVIPRPSGRPWTNTSYRNWRRRHFDPAATALDCGPIRPYDLRHSFASLMIQAGYSPVELAAELGHSPTLTLDTYAHLFSEFARGERIDVAAAIGRARGEQQASI